MQFCARERRWFGQHAGRTFAGCSHPVALSYPSFLLFVVLAWKYKHGQGCLAVPLRDAAAAAAAAFCTLRVPLWNLPLYRPQDQKGWRPQAHSA